MCRPGETTRPSLPAHLVHVVAAEAVTGVAVRTRPAVHTVCGLDAHVLAEADTRDAPGFHHLCAPQACRQRRGGGGESLLSVIFGLESLEFPSESVSAAILPQA